MNLCSAIEDNLCDRGEWSEEGDNRKDQGTLGRLGEEQARIEDLLENSKAVPPTLPRRCSVPLLGKGFQRTLLKPTQNLKEGPK